MLTLGGNGDLRDKIKGRDMWGRKILACELIEKIAFVCQIRTKALTQSALILLL